MHKTGWRRYQKGSLLVPGQPHCLLEGDETGEPLSGPPAQEASLSSLLRGPGFNGRELEAPGCGRCVLPSVVPGGILQCLLSHPLPSPGYHWAQPDWALIGSIYLLDSSSEMSLHRRGRGFMIPRSVTAGFRLWQRPSGRWEAEAVPNRGLDGHPLRVPRAGGGVGRYDQLLHRQTQTRSWAPPSSAG